MALARERTTANLQGQGGTSIFHITQPGEEYLARGIGHEGGDIDANQIDASAAVRIADWCMCEIVRVYHALSLDEAQALCDAIGAREFPRVWQVFGKKRVLDTSLSYADQTLLLLYSDPSSAVPAEDLIEWTEHSNPAVFRRDVLTKLHMARHIEWDRETHMAIIGPKGIARVEASLLDSSGDGVQQAAGEIRYQALRRCNRKQLASLGRKPVVPNVSSKLTRTQLGPSHTSLCAMICGHEWRLMPDGS